MTEIQRILKENALRNKNLVKQYNPETGKGCVGRRRKIILRGKTYHLPIEMVNEEGFDKAAEQANATEGKRIVSNKAWMEIEKRRCRHDFEFWAWRCAKIKHKTSGERVPFILNQPQRRILGLLEEDRKAGRPIRMIMLKARQWGGSTLIQMYFAWIQLVLATGKNLLICAHVKNSAAVIREMYSQILKEYPAALWEGEKGIKKERNGGFAPQLGATDTRLVPGRNATVTIASSFAQDTVRGLDCSMAHLSEVAFWMDSAKMSPTSFIRAVCSGIPLEPLTAIVMESTANGAGNFFHTEWIRAKMGESDKRAVFVPWYEIEIYRKPAKNPLKLWQSMDSYERWLWNEGRTLEMIQWYHDKRREAADHAAMMAEFPTTDTEAFIHSGCGIFEAEKVEALLCDCREPIATGELRGDGVTGELSLTNLRFNHDSTGGLKIWEYPAREKPRTDRYVVAVDVGGRSAGSDLSVIAVIDRGERDGSGEGLRIAAQWRGHLDHDLLAWKAAGIAKWYDEALLVIESNTLESESAGSSSFILEQLSPYYPRLYSRTVDDGITPRTERRYGFHTNRATKATIISCLIGLVREHGYKERDTEACSELMTYRQLPSGAYGARQGCHDDILMTRAIGLYVALTAERRITDDCSALKRQSYF